MARSGSPQSWLHVTAGSTVRLHLHAHPSSSRPRAELPPQEPPAAVTFCPLRVTDAHGRRWRWPGRGRRSGSSTDAEADLGPWGPVPLSPPTPFSASVSRRPRDPHPAPSLSLPAASCSPTSDPRLYRMLSPSDGPPAPSSAHTLCWFHALPLPQVPSGVSRIVSSPPPRHPRGNPCKP